MRIWEGIRWRQESETPAKRTSAQKRRFRPSSDLIAGTKGKGSSDSILSHILTEAGFRVGLYTSAHVSCLRERLRINNKDIREKELTSLVDELKQHLKKLGPTFKPSFFEVYTLLAFNYFRKKNVDIAIFEVGMGGTLDATNIIRPIVCPNQVVVLSQMFVGDGVRCLTIQRF